jgi:hypothetical protein
MKNILLAVEIPQRQITDYYEYRRWLLGIEKKWMSEFNRGNESYRPESVFNQETKIGGYFGIIGKEVYIVNCRFYRYDGTMPTGLGKDFVSRRGFLIKDHSGVTSAAKIHLVTNNLIRFLVEKEIEYKKISG